METRTLGQTGHESSILTFGAYLLDYLEQSDANQTVELALDHGVNHFDVAPDYGDAELKLGPKLREHREEIFLGCKTVERTYEGAKHKLERSLDRLGVDTIDLYQFHGLESEAELDTITGETDDPGALKAFREAQEEGKIDHIGLTCHAHPHLVLDTIDRIPDLESVMFPLNFTVLGKAEEDARYDYGKVLERAAEEDLGTIGLKAFAKGSWPADLPYDQRHYGTWYEPYDTQEAMNDCANYALSQEVTTITNPGDPKLFKMALDAAENYTELDAEEQADLEARGRENDSPVPAQLGMTD
ncbi:aldo/keto reductase [Halospeciosus flavus]|uniref:Aldo/keto reductase n=1 Tax=Halospeciosus flavus TaxID=3032283 RepID=A0ABD5Z9B4_9EURY|nr:aldo/keto reductase [Halospeciosus flavus]